MRAIDFIQSCRFKVRCIRPGQHMKALTIPLQMIDRRIHNTEVALSLQRHASRLTIQTVQHTSMGNDHDSAMLSVSAVSFSITRFMAAHDVSDRLH